MRTSAARASSSSGKLPPLARLGAREQLLDRGFVERTENQHPRARQQRGVELERRVLGRRADQRDRAVLHDGEKEILLGAVEAVDLVDEEQRRPAPSARRARASSKIFFRSATPEKIAETCTKASCVRLPADEPRDRRLAGAGRTPEDHRAEALPADEPGQRAVRPDQMLLPRDLAEGCGRSRSASGRGASFSKWAA